MGSTPCYRANAAFTLYGVLLPTEEEEEETRHLKRRKTHMCNKATYINSFFTTYGAMTISNALGLDYDAYATVACSYVQGSNNNNKDNKDNQGGGGGRDQGGGDKYSNYMSYTTGCESGKFVYSAFHGKYCDGNRYNGTIDYLETYNAEMEDISCAQIWDYDVSVGSNRERRDLGYGSLAETILYYSKACSTAEYPGVCPDPFGINTQYSNLLAAKVAAPYHSKAQRRLGWYTLSFALTGIALIGLSVANLIRKKRLATRTNDSLSNDGILSYKQQDYPANIVKASSNVSTTKSVASTAKSVVSSFKSLVATKDTAPETVETPCDDYPNRYQHHLDSATVASPSTLWSTANVTTMDPVPQSPDASEVLASHGSSTTNPPIVSAISQESAAFKKDVAAESNQHQDQGDNVSVKSASTLSLAGSKASIDQIEQSRVGSNLPEPPSSANSMAYQPPTETAILEQTSSLASKKDLAEAFSMPWDEKPNWYQGQLASASTLSSVASTDPIDPVEQSRLAP